MDIQKWFPEFKVSAESDKELLEYFFKTRQLESIIKEKKWMVLGRKGTGKTAIYEYIKKGKPGNLNGVYPLALNFKDYPWPIHKLYKESMEGELSAYQKSWHYLFIVKALAKLIQITESKEKHLNSELKQAKKAIAQIYGKPLPTLVDVIKSKAARIQKFALPGGKAGAFGLSGGEVSFEKISQDMNLKLKLRTNSFALLSYFEKIFLENCANYKIFICLDRLDENWLASEIAEYSKILVNLINICQFINTSSKYREKLHVLVFLRSDIYETLKFNDKNKIYQDSSIEICWNRNSLDEMLFERIKKYVPREVKLKRHKKSNSIFDMNYVRHGATPLKHILRRTFYRPRDVIVFINKLREVHTISKTGLYSSKDLYDAEKDYSEGLYNELIDEWANQRPDIEKYLNILQAIGAMTFKFNDYLNMFTEQYKYPGENYIVNILRFLFHNSIVGQKIQANWEYYCTNPHMQIDFKKPFHVNAGLKNRLMLVEGQSKQAAKSL